MRRVHPFWSPNLQRAYTEASLVVCAQGPEGLTERGIVKGLSPESLDYVRSLPYGYDESFTDTFSYCLERDQVIVYDSGQRQFSLGAMGELLVNEYLEEQATDLL